MSLLIEAIEQTRPIAYNTVKTTMSTLLDKGFVTRRRTNRWTHIYTAPPKAALLHTPVERMLVEPEASDADRAQIMESLCG